jgi:hypothetical protein
MDNIFSIGNGIDIYFNRHLQGTGLNQVYGVIGRCLKGLADKFFSDRDLLQTTTMASTAQDT